jgi:hypothetical protein
MHKMLESKVEEAICRTIERDGGKAYKFVSPGAPGVPDRLVVRQIPDWLQDVIAEYVFMVEVKAPGETTDPLQDLVHEDLRNLGIKVYIVDNPKWQIPKK